MILIVKIFLAYYGNFFISALHIIIVLLMLLLKSTNLNTIGRYLLITALQRWLWAVFAAYSTLIVRMCRIWCWTSCQWPIFQVWSCAQLVTIAKYFTLWLPVWFSCVFSGWLISSWFLLLPSLCTFFMSAYYQSWLWGMWAVYCLLGVYHRLG